MKTSRIQVTIIRSTAKAHFIADAAGRQGWIQARWLRAEDNTVSAAVLEKAVASRGEFAVEKQAERVAEAAERAFANSFHLVAVVKETEKAVAAEVILEVPGGFEEKKLVWFPKSAIGGGEGIAEVPGWMIREREARATDDYKPSGSYEAHRFCKGERPSLLRGVEILPALEVAEVA